MDSPWRGTGDGLPDRRPPLIGRAGRAGRLAGQRLIGRAQIGHGPIGQQVSGLPVRAPWWLLARRAVIRRVARLTAVPGGHAAVRPAAVRRELPRLGDSARGEPLAAGRGSRSRRVVAAAGAPSAHAAPVGSRRADPGPVIGGVSDVGQLRVLGGGAVSFSGDRFFPEVERTPPRTGPIPPRARPGTGSAPPATTLAGRAPAGPATGARRSLTVRRQAALTRDAATAPRPAPREAARSQWRRHGPAGQPGTPSRTAATSPAPGGSSAGAWQVPLSAGLAADARVGPGFAPRLAAPSAVSGAEVRGAVRGSAFGQAPGRSAPRSQAVEPKAAAARRTPSSGSRAAPGPSASSPEARWRAAVARSPLESPRAFPGRLLPLVRAVTGAATATYTTGPATRRALAAAGAHGATTRTTVHLPAEPGRADVGLLAHELSHARTALVRPRFSLRAPTGGADADERAAQATGVAVRRAVTDGFAGLSGGLPVGGASAGATALVNAAAQAARDAARDEVERALSTAGRTAADTGAGAPPYGGDGGPVAQTSGSRPESRPDSAPAAVPSALAGPGGPAGAGRQPSMEEIVRAIEDRVLQQLERRGGRYAGMF